MIVQGTNLPIILTFEDADASTFQSISAVLYPRNGTAANPIKSWTTNDMIIEVDEVRLPLEQADTITPTVTANMTRDLNVALEVKWMTEDSNVEFSAIFYDYISYRKDRTIL